MGGEDMDDVRRVASKVSIAIAFQRELAVLKRRIAAAEDGDVDGRGGWTEPAVDDADIVAAAAAGAPMRVRRGGKYVNQETDQERELAARKAAEEVETRAAGGGGGGGRRALRRRRGRLWIRARVRGRIRCEEEGGARRGPSASHGVDSSSRVAGRGAVSASPRTRRVSPKRSRTAKTSRNAWWRRSPSVEPEP